MLHIAKSRVIADIGHTEIQLIAYLDLDSITTSCRHSSFTALQFDIRSWKTNCPAALRPMRNYTGERISTPQHLISMLHMPCLNQTSDASTADNVFTAFDQLPDNHGKVIVQSGTLQSICFTAA